MCDPCLCEQLLMWQSSLSLLSTETLRIQLEEAKQCCFLNQVARIRQCWLTRAAAAANDLPYTSIGIIFLVDGYC